jgi:vacuolar iron transporter family protein
MHKSLYEKKELIKKRGKGAVLFKEFILGGQDGLVNVLGIILGLGIATNNLRITIIGGLAAMFAESVSMGAVAFTSTKAMIDYYYRREKNEEGEIDKIPQIEKKKIYDLYYQKGFRGKLLNDIVRNITSNKKRWKEMLIKEEKGLTKELTSPMKSAIIVFFAAMIGSFIPLVPLFFFSIKTAIILSLILSAVALFVTGAIEAKLTVGNWISKGFQLMFIGMAAALIGFVVGKLSGFVG